MKFKIFSMLEQTLLNSRSCINQRTDCICIMLAHQRSSHLFSGKLIAKRFLCHALKQLHVLGWLIDGRHLPRFFCLLIKQSRTKNQLSALCMIIETMKGAGTGITHSLVVFIAQCKGTIVYQTCRTSLLRTLSLSDRLNRLYLRQHFFSI